MQEVVLGSRMGVSRLMDVLVDSREVLRNDALILLIQLTKGNSNLQKIVAFENAFDKIVDIIEVEGYSDGGIVVEDCLRLVAICILRCRGVRVLSNFPIQLINKLIYGI